MLFSTSLIIYLKNYRIDKTQIAVTGTCLIRKREGQEEFVNVCSKGGKEHNIQVSEPFSDLHISYGKIQKMCW